MSLLLPFGLLAIVAIYWFTTQILPERKQNALLRPGLGLGLLTDLNDRRHQRGLPLLELDDELMEIAERKAVHQIMTGHSDEGWQYPEHFSAMFGQSLLMEILLTGHATTMADRLIQQRDVFDGEWISCGIGVAGGQTGQVALAMVLCREAWEPAVEAPHAPSWLERYGLRV
ncbi:MAG: hypothetical protein NVS2B16_02260 [Chloroflexota bacterium]